MAEVVKETPENTKWGILSPKKAPEAEAEKETPEKKKFSIKNIVVILLILAFIIYLIVDSFTTRHITRLTTRFLEAVENLGFGGVVLFGLVYIVATVLLIPGTILTIGAGFIFTRTQDGNQAIGTLIATAVVFVGATIGSTLAYLLAKYFMRKTISGWASKYRIFFAIDKAIESNGLKIVFLLRLSPLLPFNVLNYFLGITSLSLKDYLLACIGFLPGTAAFTFIGSNLGSLTDVVMNGMEDGGTSRTVRLVILIVGIIASVLAIVVTTIYARRELRKHISEEQSPEASHAAENDQDSNSAP